MEPTNTTPVTVTAVRENRLSELSAAERAEAEARLDETLAAAGLS